MRTHRLALNEKTLMSAEKGHREAQRKITQNSTE